MRQAAGVDWETFMDTPQARPSFPNNGNRGIRSLAFVILAALVAAAAPTAYAEKIARDGSILIDFGDAEYSESGAWEDGGKGWEQRGMSYSLARQTKADGAWAQWTPDLPAARTYRVYLWNIPYHAQDSKAKVEVIYDGGTKSIVKDMRAGYFAWIPLGDFPFKAGAEGFVKVTRGDRTLLQVGQAFRLPAGKMPAPRFEPKEGEFDNVTGGEMPGAGLAVKIGPDEFVLIASRVSVEWRRADGKPVAVAVAERGRFEKSRWVKTGPATPTVENGVVRFEFPRESGTYEQVRFRLGGPRRADP